MISGLNLAESGKISHHFGLETEGRDWLALPQMSLSARVCMGTWPTWAEQLHSALLWTGMCVVREKESENSDGEAMRHPKTDGRKLPTPY